VCGVASDWFATRQLSPGVHVVAEPAHVYCYLVEGSRRAVLIDTGLGIGDIRSVVDGLTSKELLVVNTHYHFDHSGGNHQFTNIAIHHEGKDRLSEPVPDEIHERYLTYTRDLLENFNVYREIDERFFHFLTEETTPRPLPEGLEPSQWRHVASVPTQLLNDGDELDLGGRHLKVLHTPGHTPDCICLFDEDNGILFGGDTINTGPIYAHLPDSHVGAFAASTRRLADLAPAIRSLYFCHFSRYEGDRRLLEDIADGFTALREGSVGLEPNADCLGYPVREAKFARFSIFLADDDQASPHPLS
jgi:glyoxylase-like metal-dependent hydrolase (beta-lactamase superfamily II)